MAIFKRIIYLSAPNNFNKLLKQLGIFNIRSLKKDFHIINAIFKQYGELVEYYLGSKKDKKTEVYSKINEIMKNEPDLNAFFKNLLSKWNLENWLKPRR